MQHEKLSLHFMEHLNEEFGGALDLAIAIFKNQYPKQFLHQLVSGQLDMDRMDYLNRDSFFTGVHEGVIGYDRIIKMLAVHDNKLVVEEKGLYSIEKFLIARRLMYWQVYLHRTVLSAEQMLIKALQRASFLRKSGVDLPASKNLSFFLEKELKEEDFSGTGGAELLDRFASLDDYDIIIALKMWMEQPDKILSFISRGIINRRLFKIRISK